jgi:hypothetical protein
MITVLKPSTLIAKGLRVEQVNNLILFKFTEELGDRLQILIDKKKADSLTQDEMIELESIENWTKSLATSTHKWLDDDRREEPFIQNPRRQWLAAGLHPSTTES